MPSRPGIGRFVVSPAKAEQANRCSALPQNARQVNLADGLTVRPRDNRAEMRHLAGRSPWLIRN